MLAPMRTDDFDFILPDELIALTPAEPRDASRLLSAGPSGAVQDLVFREISALLRPGDVLVRNVSHVIPAALSGVRPAREASGTDVQIEVNLIAQEGPGEWRAFARPGKRLRPGDGLVLGATGINAEVVAKESDGSVRLRFALEGADLDRAIAEAGAPPLPPYISERRARRARDAADYQTIYADPSRAEKSVAAPTAGLHFTAGLLEELAEQGIDFADVSLAVGAGTFLPVKTDAVADHVRHAETFEIDSRAADAINAALLAARILAGTVADLRARLAQHRDTLRDRVLADPDPSIPHR